MLNDITKIDTNFISGNSTPWIPFAPVNDKIMLKYLKIDPARGEVTMLMKVPAGEGAHKHRHTGIVTVYTIAGSWQYVGHNWVSKAGDYIFETAGSTHSFTTLGEKETVAYVMVQGELQFLDGDDKVVHFEDWRTALTRYKTYCQANRIPEINLTTYEI